MQVKTKFNKKKNGPKIPKATCTKNVNLNNFTVLTKSHTTVFRYFFLQDTGRIVFEWFLSDGEFCFT